MYVANTHLKPVIGIDIHFVNMPFPFIPLPHPYIGLVIDPFDYLPFIGATVKINNVPRGHTDTMGMIITFMHIPFGAGFTLFPMIGHDSQNFFGDKTVAVDGVPMSGAGHMLMTCNDIGIPLGLGFEKMKKKIIPIPSLYLPTSYCIPLQWGKPVRVGGPLTPNFNLMGILHAAAFGAALKIFGKLAGKLLKKLTNAVKKSAQSGKLKSLLCKMGREPVDLVTGRVSYEVLDFELPGPIPISWERTWDSDATFRGPLGHGVQLNYHRCVKLWTEEGCLSVTLEDGRLAAFPVLYQGESFYHPQEKLMLRRKQNGHYLLEDYNQSLYFHFNHDTEPGIWRLSFIENYNGHRVQLHYNGSHLRAMTDSAGRKLLFELDKQHRITRVEVSHRDQKQVLVSYTYNEEGDLATIADALNQVTSIEYNNHLMIKRTDRNGYNFYWEYDEQNRCVHTWGDGGLLEGFIEYGKGYNVVTNSLGETTTYFYDENNLCVQETDHYGNHIYTEYTDDFEIYRSIDEAGNITGYSYDDRGRMTQIIYPDGTHTQYQYNEFNQLVLLIHPDGVTETLSYDEQRRLRFYNTGDHKILGFFYNEDGQLESIVENGSRKTRVHFDEDENVASIEMADGTVDHWKYDALGRCVQTNNAAGESRFFEYDALARVRNMYLPDGDHIRLEYNAYEEITHIKDKFGFANMEYTPLGHLKKVRHQNAEEQYLYDTEERLQTIINEAGHRYLFEYNKCGQVVGETRFDGLKYRYELDAIGNIIKTIRPGGKFTKFEYDINGRVLRTEYHDGSWEAYSYNKDGNVTEAMNEHSTLRYRWSKMGEIIREEQNGYFLDYTYDEQGQCTRITSSLGADIKQQHNKLAQLTKMQAAIAGKKTASWGSHTQYDMLGRETEKTMPGGLTLQWKYDQASRPVEQSIYSKGVLQTWKKMTWDGEERLTGIFDALAKSGTSFKYDALHNLVFAQYADNSVVHRTADAAGNYYETTGKTDRRYNAAGALLESKKHLFKYDEEGNLISKTEKATNKKTSYEWYANNMLKKVVRPDGKTVEFTYDAMGRRISKKFDGKITRWVWHRHMPLHEWTYDEHEQPQAVVNEWGEMAYDKPEPNPQNTDTIEGTTWLFEAEDTKPVAKIINSKSYSIVCDHLGTPQYMYDEQGKKVWEGVLDIYGRLRTLQGSRTDCPFRFPGQYEDKETGLYYNMNRYYAAEEGQYISQDPIGLEGGLKFYNYVEDPNTWVDVMGTKGKGKGGKGGKGGSPKPQRPRVNGARARVGVKDGFSDTYDSIPRKVHAEMNGLDDIMQNHGGFAGKDVVISDVMGKMRPAPNLPVPVCAECRANMFGRLIKGRANSVTFPIVRGYTQVGTITINKKNFQKAYRELQAVVAKYNKRTHATPRSNEAWDILDKYKECKK